MSLTPRSGSPTSRDIARVAWRLMTEDQKETFKAEPEILAITDAFGDFADDQNADF